jgi:tetratricopeptide (TPR) repeat protein
MYYKKQSVQSLLKTMKHFCLVTAISISLLIQSNVYASDMLEECNKFREREIYKFSLDLFETGEYYRSITEAKRYISFFPQGEHIDDMYKLIGDSYLMSQKWYEAIFSYNELIKKFPDSPLLNNVLFNKAICLIKNKDYSQAKRMFEEILRSPDTQNKEISMRWKVLLLIRENKFDEVEKILDEEFIKDVIKDKSIIQQIISEKKNISYKSPRIAGIMSVLLPGSGQIYNKRYKDGIYSFILNALFIVGAYKAFESDNAALGGLMTIGAAGFYTGNIYSAVSGVHKYNRKVDEDFFKTGMQKLRLFEYEVRKTPNISVIFRFNF